MSVLGLFFDVLGFCGFGEGAGGGVCALKTPTSSSPPLKKTQNYQNQNLPNAQISLEKQQQKSPFFFLFLRGGEEGRRRRRVVMGGFCEKILGGEIWFVVVSIEFFKSILRN